MTVATLLDDAGQPPTIYRGAPFTFVFAVEDLTVSPTEAKNLTGATEVSFAIAAHKSSSTRDLLLSLTDSPTTVSHDNAGGNVTVTGSAAQAELLPYGTRWCELWITDAAGRRELVGSGACIIHETLINVAS